YSTRTCAPFPFISPKLYENSKLYPISYQLSSIVNTFNTTIHRAAPLLNKLHRLTLINRYYCKTHFPIKIAPSLNEFHPFRKELSHAISLFGYQVAPLSYTYHTSFPALGKQFFSLRPWTT